MKVFVILSGLKRLLLVREAEGIWQEVSTKVYHIISKMKDIEIDSSNIQETPVQSCIVDISQKDQSVTVKGFAWSGGGRGYSCGYFM